MDGALMRVDEAVPGMPVAGFDLDAYLRRVGYDAPRAPTLATLKTVVSAQVAAIPYENVDVLLGRAIRLDLATLQRKLVQRGRGGYCYESNTLLETALTSLGFAVTCLGSHVVRGLPNGAEAPGNHKLLRVDVAEGPHIVDIGLGNLTPTVPLALRLDEVQATPHGFYRFVPHGSEFMLQTRIGGAWNDLFYFSLEPMPAAIFETANRFTSTASGSPFLANLIVASPVAGGRATLYNRRFTIRHGDSAAERRILAGAADYRDILVGYFGLPLGDGELAAIAAKMALHATDEAVHPGFEVVDATADAAARPAETTDPFRAAVEHHSAGRLAQAEALYRQVLAANPRHLDALNNLGAVALQAGRNETAIYLISKALALDDRIAGCHANIGEACRRLGLLDEAAQHYAQAIALGSEPAWVHNNLGFIRHGQNRAAEALDHFRQAIARDPRYADAHSGLGFALLDLGRYPEAVAAHDAALALQPDWDSRINHLIAHGRYAEAAKLVDEAFWMSPDAAMRADTPLESSRFGEPVRRLVIHNGMHLVKNTDAGEIAEACGLGVSVVDLHTTPAHDFAAPGTLVILSSVVDQREPGIVRAIKDAEPRCRVIAWHFDNHNHYLRNARLAAAADLSVPAHATAVDYLSRWAAGERLAPIVPLGVLQWSIRSFAELYAASRGQSRSDALTGHFAFYPAARRRNHFLAQILTQWPEAEVSLKADWSYHQQSPAERFQSWREHKTSLVLPVCDDLPIRFFDALGAGQIPIVPRGILDFDRVVPLAEQARLPVVRLENYTMAALRAAHAEAIDAFDRGGESGADRRHRYVLDNHMLAHRYRTIVREAAAIL